MKNLTILTAAGILAAAAGSMTGCNKDSVPGLPGGIDALVEQCGLSCDAQAVAEGRGSISGIANIDAYFTQVANFKANANLTAEAISAPIARLKAQFGLDASADAATFSAAVAAKYQLEGGIKIAYQPPKCEVSASATVQAQASCEGKVDPGSAKVTCEGRCEADVKVTGGQASCDASAEMRCSTPSVGVACTGSCNGTCKLAAGAECTGSCSGGCKGTCKGTCDGSSTGDAGTTCAGQCEGSCTGGECQGSCDVSATGSCSGTCEGSCEVAASGGKCEGSAEVKCVVKPPQGSAKVDCSAKCSGSVTPPQASVECDASAKASAQMSAECRPPSLNVAYTFKATADAALKTQFENNFKASLVAELGASIAAMQKAKLVLNAGADLVTSVPALTSSFGAAVTEASGKMDVKGFVGIGCAVQLLPKVADALSGSAKTLSDSVKGSASFVAGLQ